MKKTVQFLILALFLVSFSTSFAQMYMDGDSTDWAAYPALIEAPDNVDGIFPDIVGAVVTDVVDIKTVKATVIGNVLFTYMEFWEGPAWPNNAYENEHEGVNYYASRGSYHILIDIDNNPSTGWSTDWYEGHYTPMGYLITQGIAYEPIGAEVMLEWGGRTNDDWEVANEGKDKVRSLSYWAADYEEYNGETDLGSDYEIFNFDVIEPDSALMMGHDGLLLNNSNHSPL